MTDETPQTPREETPAAEAHQETFRERFETLLPTIQREWPQVARQTLEATRGSFDEVAEVIASQTGRTVTLVKHQLVELVDLAGAQTSRIADHLAPLEKQLEGVLDDLNATLRPRIEKPVRERPLMALGIAAGVGVLVGLLLSSGRRSA
ncbi:MULTISPECIES: glycine zipper domain-containing protein [Aphanothece]|uniref:glycine zipper domain-containing protein n=1 Tax=Aphanothece TaxID=1121 RepID=UPI0039855B3B